MTRAEQLQKSKEQLSRVIMKLDYIGEHADYTDVAIYALEKCERYSALESKIKKVFGQDVFLQDIVEALTKNNEDIDSLILSHKDKLELQQYREIGSVRNCKYFKERYFSDCSTARVEDTENNHRKRSAFTDESMAVIGALAGIVL